jgi:hypothetical protein
MFSPLLMNGLYFTLSLLATVDGFLAGVHAVEAYAEHFEAQMHPGRARKLLAPVRVFRRTRVILLALILVPLRPARLRRLHDGPGCHR